MDQLACVASEFRTGQADCSTVLVMTEKTAVAWTVQLADCTAFPSGRRSLVLMSFLVLSSVFAIRKFCMKLVLDQRNVHVILGGHCLCDSCCVAEASYWGVSSLLFHL